MYTVMVTGGIGSGKSTLVELLRERGAYIVDLDAINRSLLESDEDLIRELTEHFGTGILDEDGRIVNRELARRAFASEDETRELNAISFPYIMEVATRQILDIHCAPLTDAKVMVVEVPLLTEVPEFARLADEVIAVSAPSELRLARCVKRGMDAADVLRRIAMQATDADRAAIADTVCNNSGTADELREWVDAWWQKRGF